MLRRELTHKFNEDEVRDDRKDNDVSKQGEDKYQKDRNPRGVAVKGISSDRREKHAMPRSSGANDLGPGDFVEVTSELFGKVKLGYITKIFEDGMFAVRYTEDEFETGISMDRIRLKSSADDAYRGRSLIAGKLTSASSVVYYPGQVVEARYRGSYRYLPATILSVKTSGSGSRYEIEFEDGTRESQVPSSWIRLSENSMHIKHTTSAPSTSLEEFDRSKMTTFSLQHSTYISTSEWQPILVTIPIVGILPAYMEVFVVPSSEHCEFYGEPSTPIWKLYVGSSTMNQCPFFLRAKSDAPEVCTGKIYFYSNSTVISCIEFEIKNFTILEKGQNVNNHVVYKESKLFKSVFLVSDEDDVLNSTESSSPVLNGILEDATRKLSTFLSIKRPEKNQRLNTTLLLSSDHIQVISTLESLSASLSVNSTSDVTRMIDILSTSVGEVNMQSFSLTSAGGNGAEDRTEISKNTSSVSYLPLHSIVYNPHMRISSYLDEDDVKEAELRKRLLVTFNSLAQKLLDPLPDTCSSPIPMGMLIFPGSFIKEKPSVRSILEIEMLPDEKINMNSWYLCFLSEDIHNKISTDEDASFKCIEIPSGDVELLYNIHPFLKATIAILMSLRFTSFGNCYSSLVAPFNGYFLAQQLDIQTLLEVNNLYEEQLNPGGKVQSPRSSPQRPTSGRSNSGSRRLSSASSPNKNDLSMKKKSNDTLGACIHFIESAYAGLSTSDMKVQLSLVLSRLNFLSPQWKSVCEMVQVSVGCRTWWICRREAEYLWNKLSIYMEDRLNGSKTVSDNVAAVSFPSTTLSELSLVARKAEQEIFSNLLKEIGLLDTIVASKCAKILAVEGCENWGDVLKLPEYLGGAASNVDCVRIFLYENRIPAIAAGKIASYIQRVGMVDRK